MVHNINLWLIYILLQIIDCSTICEVCADWNLAKLQLEQVSVAVQVSYNQTTNFIGFWLLLNSGFWFWFRGTVSASEPYLGRLDCNGSQHQLVTHLHSASNHRLFNHMWGVCWLKSSKASIGAGVCCSTSVLQSDYQLYWILAFA